MSSFALQNLLHKLITLFEENKIEYMVMGGVAVRFWGIPRPTFDLDFTLSISPNNIGEICRTLEESGFSVPEVHKKSFLDEIKGMSKFSVLWFDHGREIGVDMFLVTTEYQKSAFRRRIRKNLNGIRSWLIAPEDLIIHKLIAGRDRDLADIMDIILMNPTIEKKYLDHWANELGLGEQLSGQLKKASDFDLL